MPKFFYKKFLVVLLFLHFLFLDLIHIHAGVFSKINWKLEKSIGKMTKAQMEKEYGFINDPILKSYIDGIGYNMVKVSERNNIPYEFHILNSSEINAFAAPGGFVFVTKGLIEFIDSDDELASVVGHEIGHVVAKDSMVSLTRTLAISLGVGILGEKTESKWVQAIGGITGALMMFHYSRVDEYQADQRGAKYAFETGYNPLKMETFFQKLEKKHPTGKLSKLGVAISTHPKTPNRISAVSEKYNVNDLNLVTKIAENYFKRYYFAEAINYLEKALEIAPNNVRTIQLLAESYFNLGLYKNAKDYCLKALEFDANNSVAKEILNNINAEFQPQEKEYKKTTSIIPLAFNLKVKDLNSVEKVRRTVNSVYDDFKENIEFISSIEKKIPDNKGVINFYNGILNGFNDVFGSLVAISNLCEEVLKTNDKMSKTIVTMNSLLNKSNESDSSKNEEIIEFKELGRNLQNEIETSLLFATKSLKKIVSNYNSLMDSLIFLNDSLDGNNLSYFKSYYFDSDRDEKKVVNDVKRKVSENMKRLNTAELELNRLAFNINGKFLNEKEKQVLIKMLTLRLKLNDDDFKKSFNNNYGFGDVILLSHLQAVSGKEYHKLLSELEINDIINEYDKEEELIGANLLFHLCKMDLENIFLKQDNETKGENLGKGKEEFITANLAFAEESIEKGNFNDALEKIDEVLSIQSDNTKALLLKGKVYRKTKDFKTAESFYKKVLGLDNSNCEAYFELGVLFTDKGKFQESIAFYEKAIQINDKYAQAYLNLGYTHFKLSNYAKAEKNYKKSLELDPNLYLAHTNLGILYLTLGKKELALVEFEKSLDLNPVQPRVEAIAKKLKEE